MSKHIVFLTGAGMSQESGISTFRDSNGLWENHDIMDVASPEGFARDPKLVLDFYNARRKQLFEVTPNKGHLIIAELEKYFKVSVVTQNVDDLHERAGSKQVLHLHGELRKVRSINSQNIIYPWEKDLNLGDIGQDGFQLRPHIVWFGEAVPAMDEAVDIVSSADIVVIVGTSLQVYPAAGLMNVAQTNTPRYYIDPRPAITSGRNLSIIEEKASLGLEILRKQLLS